MITDRRNLMQALPTNPNVYEEELITSIRSLLKDRAFHIVEKLLVHSKDTFSQHGHYKKLLARCKRTADRK